MRVILSVCCESFEKCSQICSPGVLVEMGLKGPRISLGALGLRSKVSSWLGPPHMKRKMHAFAGLEFAGGCDARAELSSCQCCGMKRFRADRAPA